ncbi:MAG: hypothetical protein RL418_435 [Actinomycetota bacterium]
MNLDTSNAAASGLIYLAEVDSTNLELARRNQVEPLPDRTVLAASLQTAGQGRLGRSWVSEPETSLSVSVLLRPTEPRSLPWATLTAAASVRHAIEFLTKVKPEVKWPNDVLVDGKKVCGILAQLQPDGSLVLGVGINLKTQHGAPDTATSLQVLGFEVGFDEMLARFLDAFFVRWDIFQRFFDAAVEKTRNELIEHSATIGSKVRAELPDGSELIGMAVDLDSMGQLVINTPEPVVLSAADVWHLRN